MALQLRQVFKTNTFEQQRQEINNIAQDLYDVSEGIKSLNDLRVNRDLYDSLDSSGTPGQVLHSTDSGIVWKTQSITNLLWVTKDGDDDNDGLSPQTAKATIKSALLAANSGFLGKLQDASRLILVNKKFIQEETLGWVQNQYPLITFNTEKCKRDLGYIVDAVASDLKNGGNINCIEAALSYYEGTSLNYIIGEFDETIAAFNKARDLMILAMQNWYLSGSSGPKYSPEYSSTPLYSDESVIIDGGNPVCADIASSISIYMLIIIDILENGPGVAIQQAPSFKTTIVVKSGIYRENNPIVLPPNTGIVGDNLRQVTIIPFNPNEDIFYLNNGSYITGVTFSGHSSGQSACSFPKVQFGDPVTKECIGAANSYEIEVSDSLGLTEGMHVYGDNISTGAVISSINGTTLTLSGANVSDVDTEVTFINYIGDAGIITKSPYVQNCSSITTTGNGLFVDGHYASGTKSFVLDSYTQYNQGGDGIIIVNDGYAQLVSIFEICCDRAVYVSSGATCSITNSNTDFGNYGLIADGRSPLQYTSTVVGDYLSNSNQILVQNFDYNEPYVGQVVSFNNGGNPYLFIKQINIVNEGDGYDPNNPPTIVIDSPTGPNGIEAKAVPNIENGKIKSITVVSSGSQFIQIPNVSIVGGNPTIPATAVAGVYPSYYTISNSSNIGNGIYSIVFDGDIPFEILNGGTVYFYQVSKIIANSHCFEYVGSGTEISKARPARGGKPKIENEVVELNGGKVAFTSTNHLGNFSIGEGITINQNTGTISGEAFEKSLFSSITPILLALT